MNTFLTLAAEEVHHVNGKFLPGDMKEFYWGLVSFTIVFGLLAWKLFPIIGKALTAKGEAIADELAAADKAQADADATAAALLAKLGDADAAAEAIVTDAKSTAVTMVSDGKAKAETDAAAVKTRAAADIATIAAQATAELRNELSSQALAAAEAVVNNNLNDATHGLLVDSYIEQIGATS